MRNFLLTFILFWAGWGAVRASAATLPVNYTPTPQEVATFTIVDANGDGETFYASEDRQGNPSLRYKYSYDCAADDWAILPAVSLTDTEALYRFAADFVADSNDASLAEVFEVCMGTAPTPQAMTTVLIPSTTLHQKTYKEFSAIFSVPTAGEYYIGIHCTSPADRSSLFIRNISVAVSDLKTGAPLPPAEMEGVADATGALSATVSLTLPTMSVAGVPLSGNMTVNLEANPGKSTPTQATTTGAPGQRVSLTIPTMQGKNELKATLTNEDGTSEPTTIYTYTGLDTPGPVQNLHAAVSEDNMTIHFTYQAPADTGTHGLPCPRTGITYTLVTLVDGGGYQTLAEIGQDVFEVDYTMPADNPLTYYTYYIMANNRAGDAEEFAGVKAMAGTPFALPFEDEAQPQMFSYGMEKFPLTEMGDNQDYRVSWGFGYPGYLGADFVKEGVEAGLVGMNEQSEPTLGLMGLAKVSTLGTHNAAATITMFTGACSNIEILGQTYGQSEPVLVADISQINWSRGYNDFTFLLPESLQNRPWVQLFIRVTMSDTNEIFVMTRYGARVVADNDLSFSAISGPATLNVAETADYTVTLSNTGAREVTQPDVTFSVLDGSDNVKWEQTLTGGTVLAPGAAVNLTASLTGNVEFTSDFILRATAGDAVAELPVHLSSGNVAAVTDLRAVANEQKTAIQLSWTEPEISSICADFEGEQAGVFLPETIEGFKVVDGDDARCVAWLHFNTGCEKNSWQVIDLNDTQDADPAPRVGISKALVAVSPGYAQGGDQTTAVQAADYLISPAVTPGSAISFWARACSDQYPETIDVLYSTGGDNPEDFVSTQYFVITSKTWQQYCVQLPEDAARFALKYASYDQLGVLVDAIRYVPEGAGPIPVKYDIERNDFICATDRPAGGWYEDNLIPVEGATYQYRVIPILSDGRRGEPSNTALYTTTGIDTPMAEDGDFDPSRPIEYYDLTGRRLGSRPATGICIMRQGDLVRKAVMK